MLTDVEGRIVHASVQVSHMTVDRLYRDRQLDLPSQLCNSYLLSPHLPASSDIYFCLSIQFSSVSSKHRYLSACNLSISFSYRFLLFYLLYHSLPLFSSQSARQLHFLISNERLVFLDMHLCASLIHLSFPSWQSYLSSFFFSSSREVARVYFFFILQNNNRVKRKGTPNVNRFIRELETNFLCSSLSCLSLLIPLSTCVCLDLSVGLNSVCLSV